MLRGLLGTGGGPARWSDRLVTAGLIALVVFTPFAFGAVYQGAFTLMEAGCSALVIVWMCRVWTEGPGPARMRIGATELRRFTLPAAALFALLVFQITPVPSRALRVVSPAAYQVYAISFPGWPGLAPYQTIAAVWSTGPQPSLVGPLAPVGAPPARALRAASKRQLKAAELAPPEIGGRRWRTIALAPSVTASALIEAVSLAAVFLLLLVYPFGFVGERDAEQRFYIILLGAVIATATGVALLGLLERAWWNGRIMWFFVPQDWGGPLLTDSPRGSGPFVDPDHFANYLAMVLPLAAVGALFPMPCVPSNQRANVRFLCAGAAILIAAGIVTSMSRGGWIVATLGSSAAIALALRRASARAPALLTRMGTRLLPMLLLGGAIVVAPMLYLLGPAVRTQLGERVGATVAGAQNLQYKPRVWADTLQMVHEFPVFGVGLGCWPEIFPHYQRPPWSPFFYREAENDYLQFVAETGLAGLALIAWLGLAIGMALWRGARGMQERSWPLYAGLIGGVAAAVLHEAVDFSFHTPANALLFAILLALTLRIAFTAGVPPLPRIRRAPQTTKGTYLRALAAAAAAAGFIVFAHVQDGRAYPYTTGQRRGLVRAAAELAAHPAMAATHLMLVAEMPRATSALLRLDQLHAAVWLDPNQPGARDLYAQSLLLAGRAPEGLAQVSLAVYRAPQLNEHYYLEPRVIPWLLPAEQEAIARGFNWAVQARFDYAAKELGSFYAQLGRYREAGTLEVAEAHEAVDDTERANYLVRAGRDYESAGDIATAARVLKQASASDPTNPQPYAELIKMIYGPEHDFPGADAVVRQGIANGADPYMLEMAMANTAMAVGDDPAAEKALLGAIRYQSSFEAKLRLGEVYMNENRFDRAALTFQQAIDLKPDSAEAYDALGRANEGAYNYFEAAKAYRHASELAPNDRHLRQNYDDFEQRTAQSAEEAAKAAKGNGHAAAVPAASPVTDGDASGGADSRPLAPTPDTDSQP